MNHIYNVVVRGIEKPQHLVATVIAKNATEAVKKASEEEGYCEDVLCANEIAPLKYIYKRVPGKAVVKCFPYRDPFTHIAMAVVIDNEMDDYISMQDWLDFRELGCLVANEMARHDEPRFTLYDYLDAAVNHIGADWKALLKSFQNDPEAAFQQIVTMAEDKRRTYEP